MKTMKEGIPKILGFLSDLARQDEVLAAYLWQSLLPKLKELICLTFIAADQDMTSALLDRLL